MAEAPTASEPEAGKPADTSDAPKCTVSADAVKGPLSLLRTMQANHKTLRQEIEQLNKAVKDQYSRVGSAIVARVKKAQQLAGTVAKYKSKIQKAAGEVQKARKDAKKIKKDSKMEHLVHNQQLMTVMDQAFMALGITVTQAPPFKTIKEQSSHVLTQLNDIVQHYDAAIEIAKMETQDAYERATELNDKVKALEDKPKPPPSGDVSRQMLEMKEKLKNSDATVKMFIEQIGQMKKDHKDGALWKRKKALLDAKVQDLTDLMEMESKQAITMRSTIETLEADLVRATEELDVMHDNEETLQGKVSMRDETLKQLSSINQALELRLKEGGAAKRAQPSDDSAAAAELAALKEQHAKLVASHEVLQAESKESTVELTGWLADAEKELTAARAKCTDVEKTNERLHGEVAAFRLKQQIASAEGGKEAPAARPSGAVAARSLLVTVMKRRARLRDKHTQLQEEHTALQQAHKQLSSTHAASQAERQAMSDANTALQGQLDALHATHSELAASHEQLQTKAAHQSLKEEHAAVAEEHEKLVVRHGELVGNHASLTTNHSTISEAHGQLRTDNEQLTERHTQLTTEHEELGRQHSTLEQQLKDLAQEHGELGDVYAALDGRRSTLRTKHAALEEDHNKLGAENERLCDTHATLKRHYSQMSDQHKELEQKRRILLDDNDTMQDDHDRLEQSHEELTSRTKELREQTSAARAEHEQLQRSHAQLGDDHRRLQEDHQRLVDEHAALTGKQTELQSDHKLLSESAPVLVARVKELNSSLATARDEVEELRGANDALEAKVDQMRATAASVWADELDAPLDSDLLNATCSFEVDDDESMDAESIDAAHTPAPDDDGDTDASTPPQEEKNDVIDALPLALLPEFAEGDEVEVVEKFEDNDLNEIPTGVKGRVHSSWMANKGKLIKVQLEGYISLTLVYKTDVHCIQNVTSPDTRSVDSKGGRESLSVAHKSG